ncbi:GNAT family N-acetyltransferase [Halorubrum trueperi]|uniref:GNAT family N-acetyltransferase n=1 Tax=Halorubrum trueperi TaxID=2004704 RepID=A0ABD5UPD0_9EURY
MADSDRVRVTTATAADVDRVTDLWIALAAGQRRHGSTLLAEENRNAVREWVARSVVTGELLVAREEGSAADIDDGRSADGYAGDDSDPDGGRSDDGHGEPVGFVGFSLDRGGYDRDRTRGTVSNLFVVPDRRGEGIGAELLCAAEDALREAGAETVALEALAANGRARGFYADRGYETHRVEMTKSLGAETAGPEAGDEREV